MESPSRPDRKTSKNQIQIRLEEERNESFPNVIVMCIKVFVFEFPKKKKEEEEFRSSVF